MLKKWKRLSDGWFRQPQGTTTQIIMENALVYRCPKCNEMAQVKFRYTTKTWEGHKVSVIPEAICGRCSVPMLLVDIEKENTAVGKQARAEKIGDFFWFPLGELDLTGTDD